MKPDFFSAEKIEELSFGGRSIKNIMSEKNLTSMILNLIYL